MCKPNRTVGVSKINKMATGNVTSERSHGNMDYLYGALTGTVALWDRQQATSISDIQSQKF